MSDLKPFDEIYLQWNPEYPEAEVTWCEDQINDDDIPYVLKSRALAAEQKLRELQERTEICRWKMTDDEMSLWEGDCGAAWNFIEGGDPKENELNYCPKCGRKLVQVDPEPPEAENE